MNKEYGFCRISRPTQKISRQIENILKEYPNATIKEEIYTGTKVEGREVFQKLLKEVETGDTIVFDSVSRMSRNADEGIELYFDLYNMGVNLIFLKEPYINTEVYNNNLKDKIELTGTDEDELFIGINNYFRRLAKRQIKIAFDQAEKEVKDLQERTSEGIREARKKGKQIGQKQGVTLNVKKKEPIKQIIKSRSKDFYGTLKDIEVIAIINSTSYTDSNGTKKKYHVSNNTYYKYKKELADDLKEKQDTTK